MDLRAATYRVLCPDGEVVFDLRAATAAGFSGPVAIDIFEVTYGDATSDGDEDAVIRLSCVFADGGNASASAVLVVSSEPGGPRQVGQPIEGHAAVLVGGRLVVSRAVYGPEDARCCPGGTAHVPVRLDGDRWVDGVGGDALDATDVATTGGLGPLRVGATYDEVAAASGQSVLVEDPLGTGAECVYVSIDSLPDVHALGGAGTVHSVEVDDPVVRTSSGLGVGSGAAAVEAALPGRITAEPHLYVEGGEYLVFTPVDEPGRVAMFETDGQTVTRYRVGETGWALAYEGCL